MDRKLILGAITIAVINELNYAAMPQFFEDSSEPRVTEKPKRRKVRLPVLNAHAKPLRERKRLLARKCK